ncbi:O-antigen ligase family protein [Sphingomonas psychrotolerans]|uniref:O-antigen ligase family protein n=1 Tax=Sphingomonas psychrotolerans TaxID=1327635 RepID=A0ABU3N5C6_9SPHN|nr:O-antigen ligase family protein [Sphingomonas psychrotolerans]MDT8759734.1 O-antigen ligase family protein [Sphingomonas psychrotolerans]
MRNLSRINPRFAPSVSFLLLCLLMVALWLAGGASRGDVPGQAVVRSAAAAAIAIALLFGPRPSLSMVRPVAWLLALAILLPLLQLVPLPPALWQAFPGRALFGQAADLLNEAQPWRPWTIAPGLTINAAASLIVPAAVLLLVAGAREDERASIPGLLLALISASTLLGLLQLSGVYFNSPLINDSVGQVSATFANRNHFALFLALGCLLAPVWPFLGGRSPGWRAPVAFALGLLFALTIVATGSRAGILVGAIGLAAGLWIVRQGIRRTMARYPRWTFPAIVAAIPALIGIFVLLAIAAGRAASIERLFTSDTAQDMRTRGLPTVLEMIKGYFPTGTGFGTFDRAFRIHEPFALLKPTYFNHAHNDLLEVFLEGGIAGGALLAAALAWLVYAGIRAWRAGPGTRQGLPKAGAVALLLIVIASAFDYPARTPMVMAIIILAASWLSESATKPSASALPQTDQHL